MTVPRWIVTCYYRSDAGLVDVEHNIDELHELAALIENGPDWNTLDHIRIELNDRAERPTIEANRTK